MNRLGDFYGDQIGKLEFVLETALEHDCKAILQPGDLGQSANWSNYLKQHVLSLLKHYSMPILCVMGQHDQKYHSLQSVNRTSLRVLEAAEVVHILGETPYNLGENVDVYGLSFGEEVPEVKRKCLNILVAHKMVIKGKADRIWLGQRDYTTVDDFAGDYPDFDLMIFGDNHQGFLKAWDDALLVNCGALVRAEASKGMVEHKPFVVIYDTESHGYGQIYIPIKPAAEVLNREKVEENQEKNEGLEAFMSGLSSEYSVELEFRKNMEKYLSINEIIDGVLGILKEVFGDIGGQE